MTQSIEARTGPTQEVGCGAKTRCGVRSVELRTHTLRLFGVTKRLIEGHVEPVKCAVVLQELAVRQRGLEVRNPQAALVSLEIEEQRPSGMNLLNPPSTHRRIQAAGGAGSDRLE